MKLLSRSCLAALVLFLSALQLPAPVAEETPTATPPKPKPKPKIEKEPASSDSSAHSSTRGFDGTWTGSMSQSGATFSYVTKATLIIKQANTADLFQETTSTLAAGQYWSGMPEDYKFISPIFTKIHFTSNDIRVDGSNLRVRWTSTQLVDWSPKTIPATVMQSAASQTNKMSVYTLKGNQLTREFDSNGGVTYTRVR